MLRATVVLVLATLYAQGQTLNQRIQNLVPPAEVATVEAALNAHDYARAQQLLTAIALNDTNRPELLAVQGALAFVAADMRSSAENFAAANHLKRLSDADSFTWAMAVLKLGDNAHARQILSGLSTANPTNALYIYWLAKIDYYERRYAEAVTKLQQAIKLDPNSARAWDSLGLAYDMQAQMQEARQAFEKAVALNRTQPHPSAWPPHDLGYLQLRQGHTAEAEASLRESLQYDPALVDAHYHLGRVLEKEERYPDAIDQYQLAVNGDPAATDACYSLAMLYRKLNRDIDSTAMFAEYKKRKQNRDREGATVQTPEPVR
jgi:tetratricopeptide (TPR) repeat protein